MEEFKVIPGDLEGRSFNVESITQGDVWPFSAEEGTLSLAVVLWMSGTAPADAEDRTRDAKATAQDFAREKGWLTL